MARQNNATLLAALAEFSSNVDSFTSAIKKMSKRNDKTTERIFFEFSETVMNLSNTHQATYEFMMKQEFERKNMKKKCNTNSFTKHDFINIHKEQAEKLKSVFGN